MAYTSQFFGERKAELDKQIAVLEKKSFKLSLVRLFVFLLTAASVVASIVVKNYLILIASGILFVLFVYLCMKHYKVNGELKYDKALAEVNDRYIARCNGDFSKLTDKGSEFALTDHDYCVDLDIFGEASLFALYNISESAFGRAKFADELLNAHVSDRTNDDIRKRQAAVRELSSDPLFLESYQAYEKLGKIDKMPEALLKLSKNEYVSFTGGMRLAVKLLLLLWLIPFVTVFAAPKFLGASIMFIVIVNLIASFSLSSKYSECFRAVEGISRQTDALASLYTELEKHDFKDPLIRSLIYDEGVENKVSDSLKSLAKTCALAKVRMQPLVALVLNALCLYDAMLADKFTAWAEKYGKRLEKNVENLAVIESLMSASVVSIISRYSVTPELVDCGRDDKTNAFFDGKQIVHPLLDPEKAVSNSIKIDGKTALITGSNMSGKTTLIRTIGVCSILAYIGADVPAESLKLGRMRVVSSMRIVDDMKEEMSTFRAELVRISRIVKAGREGHPLLFLIDEIFRGTNSADRTEGAMTVLKILAKDEIIGLMTTHDYALCDEAAATMPNISYFHFSETYDDNGIYFDYKLKDGVSNISNAKYLMKLVGIII